MDRKQEDNQQQDHNGQVPDEALVDGYIDGELEGEQLASFEEKLGRDAQLRARVEGEQKLSEAMRSALRPDAAPDALRDSIADMIRASAWDESGDEVAETPAVAASAAPAASSGSTPRRRAAAARQPVVRRRLFPRVAALAATVALLLAGFQLVKAPGSSGAWPWLIEESVRLFDEALVASVSAAEPSDVPVIETFEFERVFCKGKGRDGALNPCFIYKSVDGGTIGYFCLDDRIAKTEYVRYGPRTARIGNYSIVASGPPGAMHLWVAKGIEPEALQQIVRERAGERGVTGHMELSVDDMECSDCADRIIEAVEGLSDAIEDCFCDVENRRVFVMFKGKSAGPDRETIRAAIAALDLDD